MDEGDLKQKKSALRKDVLARRDAISVDERRLADEKAASWALSAFGVVCRASIETGGLSGQSRRKIIPHEPQIIGLFWPIRSEIDCLPLARSLRAEGLTLALPFCLSETEMEFRRWDENAELISAGFGTRAPSSDAEVVVPDVVLMPLAGFDAERNRLGYGAGFYDRYLGRFEKEGREIFRAGYAYASQQLDNVPTGLYDLSMNIVITDQGFV